jgi:hypothetical protein
VFAGLRQIRHVQQPLEQTPTPLSQYKPQSLRGPVPGQVPRYTLPGPSHAEPELGAAVACVAPNPSDPAITAPNTMFRTVLIACFIVASLRVRWSPDRELRHGRTSIDRTEMHRNKSAWSVLKRLG